MAYPNKYETLVGFEHQSRTVRLVWVYDDGVERDDYLPENVAELLVAMMADGWSPYEIELQGMALGGVEITSDMLDMTKKRVVSTRIEYGSSPKMTVRSDDVARARDAVMPDFETHQERAEREAIEALGEMSPMAPGKRRSGSDLVM